MDLLSVVLVGLLVSLLMSSVLSFVILPRRARYCAGYALQRSRWRSGRALRF